MLERPPELTGQLLEEHRLIKRALIVLTRARVNVEAGADPDPQSLRLLLRFFDEYVEGHHRRKEENQLQTWLVAKGVPWDRGILADLLADHDQLRTLIRRLTNATHVLLQSPRDALGRNGFARFGEAFAATMWSHMRREERELFPLADRLDDGSLNLGLSSDHEDEVWARYSALVGFLEQRGLAQAPTPSGTDLP